MREGWGHTLQLARSAVAGAGPAGPVRAAGGARDHRQPAEPSGGEECPSSDRERDHEVPPQPGDASEASALARPGRASITRPSEQREAMGVPSCEVLGSPTIKDESYRPGTTVLAWLAAPVRPRRREESLCSHSWRPHAISTDLALRPRHDRDYCVRSRDTTVSEPGLQARVLLRRANRFRRRARGRDPGSRRGPHCPSGTIARCTFTRRSSARAVRTEWPRGRDRAGAGRVGAGRPAEVAGACERSSARKDERFGS